VAEEIPEEAEVVGASKLANVKPPIANFGDVIGSFSGGELIKNPTTGSWQTHNGTDLSAEVGTEVYAVSNGEITEVTKDSIWGVTVVLDHHNGYVTYYAHNSSLLVRAGDKVYKGQQIAKAGSTGRSTGVHCHFGIEYKGSFINPLNKLP
jgi:murein DD-endopeptidase MepM/ murein hydrolase activator NlpD